MDNVNYTAATVWTMVHKMLRETTALTSGPCRGCSKGTFVLLGLAQKPTSPTGTSSTTPKHPHVLYLLVLLALISTLLSSVHYFRVLVT